MSTSQYLKKKTVYNNAPLFKFNAVYAVIWKLDFGQQRRISTLSCKYFTGNATLSLSTLVQHGYILGEGVGSDAVHMRNIYVSPVSENSSNKVNSY